MKEEAECTFKPRVNKSRPRNKYDRPPPGAMAQMSVLERNMLWEEQKKAKLKQQ